MIASISETVEAEVKTAFPPQRVRIAENRAEKRAVTMGR
jgi:hypothetical protein